MSLDPVMIGLVVCRKLRPGMRWPCAGSTVDLNAFLAMRGHLIRSGLACMLHHPIQLLNRHKKIMSHPLALRAKIALSAMMILLIAGLHTPTPAAAETTITGTTMGSIVYRVTLHVEQDLAYDALQNEIDHRLGEVNDQMSTWAPDSELSRFNQSESTDWFAVSPELAKVVDRSLEVSRGTEGAFDVTVGPLVNLWNFGPDGSAISRPTEEQIAGVLANVGYQYLHVRTESPAIKKDRAGVYVDLSAIAKGYAVDVVAALLDSYQIENYLVDIGGENRSRGKNSQGERWRIGIEKPIPGVREIFTVVELSDQSIATSGDYRNFHMVDGNLFSHTISPFTGKPVVNGPASVSVIANDCMTADAVATAIMVAGSSNANRFADLFDVQVLALDRSSSGIKETTSDSFPFEQTAEQGSAFWSFFVAALVVFAISLLGMAVGVLFSKKPIKGSCGGLGNLRSSVGLPPCECSDPPPECKELIEKRKQADVEANQTNALKV